MQSTGDEGSDEADAILRGAHLWIRSLCMNEFHKAIDCQFLARGLVAGLSERLELDPRIRGLVSYVFKILDKEGGQALSTLRMMPDLPLLASQRHMYENGRSEAAAIVEMLLYVGSK